MREAALIEFCARAAHEVNRAYCISIGDDSQPLWEKAPDWQIESAKEGVKGIMSGEITAPRDLHAAWLAKKISEGWAYGEKKDPETKTHPCMVGYDKLPEAQQVKDDLFFNVVRALIKAVEGS